MRINAKSFQGALSELLSSDADIIKSAGELFTFYALASSGEPLAFAAGLALVAKAASAGVKIASELIRRLGTARPGDEDALPPYERFRMIFYTAALRAYLDSVQPVKDMKSDAASAKEQSRVKPVGDEIERALGAASMAVEESEVPFLLGVDPLKGDVPLYSAINEWLLLVLERYGYPEYQIRPVLQKVVSDAKQRFQSFVASDADGAMWMRNYLLLASHRQTEQIASDLSSVRIALDNWLQAGPSPKARQAEAWERYRRDLMSLPDDKDSMYNESFGVREVFVKPEGTYCIAGAPGDAGKPQAVPDLGVVLGGLLTNRVSNDDLIILCGGPGSGKSTLCRVLASELSTDRDVFPLFLRLRRLKEGSDIPAFLDSQLSRLGLVDRISDLRSLSNVVVILDGFDELVMASRSRLRQFFNALREDHTNGPLKDMRIIVSGRDTLFPGGEGLPTGSHVLRLQPFDRVRVAAWGEKWRLHHKSGGGATFHPERLVAENQGKPAALHHLVTWPLTLHLVARVHTSGRLTVADEHCETVTKALLYRNILAETATRQREKTAGGGRLEPTAMRRFLQALAWRMYVDGRDSMDPGEVLPILEGLIPNQTEAELSELADVAVVNSPEITKGEQTGFEFVHKSFAEYLAAEHIAITVERVTFEAPEYGSDQVTWRMTETEAAAEMAKCVATRLVTAEVQEMLEPMLGDFDGFSRGLSAREQRMGGLLRIIRRFESLLHQFLRGRFGRLIEDSISGRPHTRNLFEASANFAAGLVFLGGAASRQLNGGTEHHPRPFILQPFDGAFWRLVCLLHTGGIHVDSHVAERLFNGCAITAEQDESSAPSQVSDMDNPIKTGLFGSLPGFQANLEGAARIHIGQVRDMLVALQLATLALAALSPELAEPSHGPDMRYFLDSVFHGRHPYRRDPALFLPRVLQEAGLLSEVPELGDRLPDDFRHGIYGLLREGTRHHRVPESLVYTLREMLDYWDRRGHRFEGTEGPGYSDFFLRVLVGIVERPSKKTSAWAEQIREALRHIR